MKKKVLGILVCIIFLISVCSIEAIGHLIPKKENLFSNERNGEYCFGDLYVTILAEGAAAIINNEPGDGLVFEKNKEWKCTLNIDYLQEYPFKYIGTIEVKAFCIGQNGPGQTFYVEFFNNESDFEFAYPNIPDDIYLEVIKIIPGGYFIFSISLSVSADVYYFENGDWVFHKHVNDSDYYRGKIFLNKNLMINNVFLNFFENHPNLLIILEKIQNRLENKNYY